MKRAGEMRVTRCASCGIWCYLLTADALATFTATGTARCRHCAPVSTETGAGTNPA